ncbi:MAG: hypothetical protein D6791_03140 [Chloroflexi bacterium]|nr:MAG: hypothetical protein D6791_03140 [Chloroflexota bacterium]
MIHSSRLVLPWGSGFTGYFVAWYLHKGRRGEVVRWENDKFAYPVSEPLKLHWREPMLTLKPVQEPAGFETPDERFVPVVGDWFERHEEGVAFRVHLGGRPLDSSAGGDMAAGVRFSALYHLEESWAGITDRDNVLLLDGIERVEVTDSGGLAFAGRGSYGSPRACFDEGGKGGRTVCAVWHNTGVRLDYLGPEGGQEEWSKGELDTFVVLERIEG